MLRRLFGLDDTSNRNDEKKANKSRKNLLEEAYGQALDYGFRRIAGYNISSDFFDFFEKLHDCSYENGISKKLQSIMKREENFTELYQRELSEFLVEDGRVHDEMEFLQQLLTTLCFYESCVKAVDGHADILLSKKKQLVYSDEFGDEVTEKWDRYFSNYFISKLEPVVDDWISTKRSAILNVFASGDLNEKTGSLIRSLEDEKEGLDLFKVLVKTEVEFYVSCLGIEASSDDQSPVFEGSGHEYEYHLLDRLQNETTVNAEVTSGSGDQGADLLVYFEGETFAIQAKHYSSPVGNKAVQEAFSALTYYKADHAVVVANSGFTRSANELALRTGVKCVNESQLISMFASNPSYGKESKASESFFELLVESFGSNKISVESVTFDGENSVHLVTLALEQDVYLFGLSEEYTGSAPSISELEYYQDLVEDENNISVIKIVPDFLESDLLEVLADLEEKYDGAMVFKTDKEACEMIS